MDLGLTVTKENKDGSANAEVDFDKEGLETLVQCGLVSMLTAAIDEYRVRPEKGSDIDIKRTRPTTTKPVAKKKASKK